MPAPHKNNPIIDQFRVAGRLVNEWRDTIYYAGAAAGAAKFALMGEYTGSFCTAILSGAVREGIREFAWQKSRGPEVLVGFNQPLSNAEKLANDAGTVNSALLAIGFLAGVATIKPRSSFNELSAGLMLAITYSHYVKGRGIRSLIKDYSQIMWDYPRKRGGGGTSQTQKLKDGFNDLVKQTGKLLPRPAIGVGLVPLRIRRNVARFDAKAL